MPLPAGAESFKTAFFEAVKLNAYDNNGYLKIQYKVVVTPEEKKNNFYPSSARKIEDALQNQFPRQFIERGAVINSATSMGQDCNFVGLNRAQVEQLLKSDFFTEATPAATGAALWQALFNGGVAGAAGAAVSAPKPALKF